MSATIEPAEQAAAVDHVEHDEHHKHDHKVPGDAYFIKVAIILAIVTALETSTYWWPSDMERFATAALIIMMVIKFVMIASIFMHLRYDSKIFSFMFYTGLFLALFVYAVYLFTFQFFRP